MTRRIWMACLAPLLLAGCGSDRSATLQEDTGIEAKLSKYTSFRLTAETGGLTENQKKMIPLLIEAADQMNAAFWMQAYPGNREKLLSSLDDKYRRFAEINYGPWDRLDDNKPFVDGVGPKPAGANLYPADMTKEEFVQAAQENPKLQSLYTIVRRNAQGGLQAVPYSEAFSEQYSVASSKLLEASELAEDAGLKRYLELRAQALVSDDYQAGDLAWMDMKDNTLDIVIGPIETYEDQLFGYKAGNEAYVLIKDRDWSERLSRYVRLLPELQKELPVEAAYRQETPGLESDLNAYDVVYYAGDCNAGSKTIAINLPNDEQVQLQKGTRRLQLKNAMRAKFDKILVPLADVLIGEVQRGHIQFDSFFSNVMFHEVAHGLGIKQTLDGKGTVRAALKEQASALEEAKADILGLFMVTRLIAKGELQADIRDNYVTFLASIFRSVRFGAANAHGLANLAELNFLSEAAAFTLDAATGAYLVDLDKMQKGVEQLAARILTLQGDGDYQGVKDFMQRYGQVSEQLQKSLDSLAGQGIPVDIVFEQGRDVLGL